MSGKQLYTVNFLYSNLADQSRSNMELYLIKYVVPFSQEPLGYILGQLSIANIDSSEDLCDNLFNNAFKITSLIQIGYHIISDVIFLGHN